ncbi:MAG TPA: hypothetical protein VE621_19760, partial [Bryobacteraceae bacterium]|nr:hypothetical protein [Bryobacteraceae bacterium]
MRGSILVCSILIASLASVLPQGTPKANVGSDKISAKPAEQAAAAPADGGDVIIRAMKEELARSRELAISSLDVPYFIEYEMDEATQFSVSASLGGILQSSQNRFRIPRARVRVGDYKFDNTNYVFADLFGGTRYASERFPLDDNLRAIRFEWWLATDRAYKGAVEAIARKRAALKNITQADEVPDFWKATPVTKVMPVSKFSVDTARWTNRVREWSNLFVKYPEV